MTNAQTGVPLGATTTTVGHRVGFHETDAMGIVHHANYLRHFENARVAWLETHDRAYTEWIRYYHYMHLLTGESWYEEEALRKAGIVELQLVPVEGDTDTLQVFRVSAIDPGLHGGWHKLCQREPDQPCTVLVH